MLLQGFLPVLIKEELGILQAGPEHALIAVLHSLQEITAAITDSDKEGQQLAVLQHREVTLMVTHRGNNRLGRELQVLLVKLAAEGSRILYQIENLLQQILVDFSLAAICLGHFSNLLPDHIAALILVNNDKLLLTSFLVSISGGNLKITFGQEAMAPGNPAGLHSSYLEVNNILTVQSHQPAQRTDKFIIEICPMHVVREIQAIHQACQGVPQQVAGPAPYLMHHGVYIAVLGHQILCLDALSPGEALGSLGRIALSIKSDIHGRAAVFLGKISLLLCQPLHNQGSTARRANSPYILILKAQSLEGLGRILLQLGQDTRHYMSRNLLSTDFQ